MSVPSWIHRADERPGLPMSQASGTIVDLNRLLVLRAGWRQQSVVVFTNGCFDLLHRGHIEFFQRAKSHGDVLIVGLNSDASVRAIKGPGRPLVRENDRAAILGALACVDHVTIFDEPTPARLIAQLEPDVLVKGGDWPVTQIIGSEVVLRRNGLVLSLPLLAGHSTTALIERILTAHTAGVVNRPERAGEPLAGLADSICVMQRLLAESGDAILKTAKLLADTLKGGGKVLLFGNGGSAAEAQHIAAELVGRFHGERRPLPALALTTDSSVLTALGNDYGFERVFARQIEALANPGDVAVALSTSGSSPNVLAGVMAARERTCKIIGVTGARGTRLAALCDAQVLVPSEVTSRVQEASLTIGHLWCEIIEASLKETGER